jgi:acyl-[acyl-carrier-protein]-phospholipid O-acyltransferase/long-chain-fatty-acid--[acyl-carrier-protein] ligase
MRVSSLLKMSTTKAPKLVHIPVHGRENIPVSGALILPSHLDFEELRVLNHLLEGRPLAYLVQQGASVPVLDKLREEQEDILILRLPDSRLDYDLEPLRQRVWEVLNSGTVLIYVPAEMAVQPGSLTSVLGSQIEMMVQLGAPLVPLFVQRNQELVLAIDSRRAAGRSIFAFGPMLHHETLSTANYQQSILELSAVVFAANPKLERNLAYALLKGLKKHGSKASLIDGKDEKVWPYSKVLAMAIALSREVKKATQKPRVGIILPPGLGGMVANLAVLFAGKVPVNLNFTAGRPAVESAMKQAELDHYITADMFVRKLQTFPWPPNRQMMFLERVLPGLKSVIARWFVLAKILPTAVLAALLGIPRKGGDEEALLLFTSGSSGEPKGVALSHRNLLANVTQFSSRITMDHRDGILGCLPLFHSFGCTVTLWFPILQGFNLVTYPTPLESKKLAELIHKYKVTLFVTTPTFLRGYLKGVNPELFTSLKMIVTGAEKLQKTVAEAFQARFGIAPMEGYGLTETSPASNVNLPNLTGADGEPSGVPVFPSHRFGSVGQLMPGLALRVTDVDTDEPRSLHESGMIWFKGANVFNGYLKNPKKSGEVLKDGWFRTGDIGRVDADGFVYVEGRLSRFSKVGGEMVPHETVEEALVKALNLESELTRKIAVVGVPDEEKGESLILLSAMPGGSVQQEILDVRYKLLDRGVPPLWIPKKLVRVQEIPILSSGKLDVRACEQLAKLNS